VDTDGWPRRRYYGIAEIADALGIDRQLVTVWRRRSSHGMPAPDDELSSGPLWLAATIEPWISLTRARMEAEATAQGAEHLTPAMARRTARQLFRLTELLLEEPRVAEALAQCLRELGELHQPLATAAGAVGGSRRGLADLAALARMAGQLADRVDATRNLDDLLAACLQVVPHAARLLTRVERD